MSCLFQASLLKPLMRKVATWRYRFARDILADMAELLCSAKIVPYSEIMELDGRLQAFLPHRDVFRPRPSATNATAHAPLHSREDKHSMLTLLNKQRGAVPYNSL